MNRFENGFDSFKKAIQGLENRKEDEYVLKDIIINFHHAIEVIFKHILYNREKCLIYSDIDNWIDNNFKKKLKTNKDDNIYIEYTITFEETLKRIIVLCEVSINSYTYDNFKRLSKLRNSLIHDEVKLDRDEVEQLFVSLLTTVTSIMHCQLPEADRSLFDSYVDSDKYNEILNKLFEYNSRWRTITIANLLQLYIDKEFETLNSHQIKSILKSLSALGVYMSEDDYSYEIDGDYYFSYFSYLKQEICSLLIYSENDVRNGDKILNLVKNNDVVKKVVEEYLVRATLYVYELLGNVDENFFDDESKVKSFFDNNLLINNHDIYVILFCIYRITNIYVGITGEKRRENLLKKIFLDSEEKLSIQKFYSALIEWFKQNNWYNSITMKNLKSFEKVIFGLDPKEQSAYDELCESVVSGVYDNELYQEIIGEMGEEWGTIDNVDEVYCEELTTVIKYNNLYSAIFDISLGTQVYKDHEYYDNGSTNCFVEARGTIVDNKFKINNLNFLGRCVGFHSFKFD